MRDHAWPSLIDSDTFAKVQKRRQAEKNKAPNFRGFVRGLAIKSEYLLTGLMVCGGKMSGATTRSNSKTYRYYVCGNANNHPPTNRHPQRFTVPADLTERFALDLIQAELVKLRDDDQLHQHIADELAKLAEGNTDARDQMQARLADLDQQAAQLRGHLLALDPVAAKSLGLYAQAESLATDRADLQAQLADLPPDSPAMPPIATIRKRAAATLAAFTDTFDATPLEERRALIAHFIHHIETDPTTHTATLHAYPAFVSQKIAGAFSSHHRNSRKHLRAKLKSLS